MMNYNDILFFIGKSLTIKSIPNRIPEIRKVLQSEKIDWEMFVLVCSNQMVVPAIYIQYKFGDLLKELPSDLEDYLEEVYLLNRDRNKQIKNQSFRVIALLNNHGIYPIFLKGVGYLLDNLYDDIGERMIGDIDFLVCENCVVKSAGILKRNGYVTKVEYSKFIHKKTKHYPRLIKNDEIAAVEVHFRPVIIPFDKEFGFRQIDNNKKKLEIDGLAYVLSGNHQLIYNAMIVQFTDSYTFNYRIALRQVYDHLLLSEDKNNLNVLRDFGHYFIELNNYFALFSKICGIPPSSRSYNNNTQAKLFIKKYIYGNVNIKLNTFFINLIMFFKTLHVYIYAKMMFKAIYDKDMRRFIYSRLSDINWYKKRFMLSVKRL